jgi:AbrB family looped-hinge helix DNA binding protein
MTTTKIGEKGQLTVPKQFREDLGLGIGAPFAVLRLGDGLILLPEQRHLVAYGNAGRVLSCAFNPVPLRALRPRPSTPRPSKL